MNITKEELQKKLDDMLSFSFNVKVGAKYIVIDHYWAKSPIDSTKGEFNKSFRVKIEDLLPYLEMGQEGVEGYLGWFV